MVMKESGVPISVADHHKCCLLVPGAEGWLWGQALIGTQRTLRLSSPLVREGVEIVYIGQREIT